MNRQQLASTILNLRRRADSVEKSKPETAAQWRAEADELETKLKAMSADSEPTPKTAKK